MFLLQTLLSYLLAQFHVLHLAQENLALRQQLAVLKRRKPRPMLQFYDRWFWMLYSRICPQWKTMLILVKPETVIRWHRNGFKWFWTRKSRKPGRPIINAELHTTIRQIAQDNPTWGAPRIHGELIRLGFTVSERTVSRLMPKRNHPSSGQTWRTFLQNHASAICAMDFLTVPTATFRILYVLAILSHDRREVLHFNVTSKPTAAWTAQQLKEAFPWKNTPKYLIRDRDGIYGEVFRNSVENMGIKEVVTSYRSPWQNGHVERLIGSVRRECLDHVIPLGEKHLRRILREYFAYYNHDRTHCGIDKDAPLRREIQIKPIDGGKIVALPRVGGLHHRYEWQKAA